MNGLMKKEDEEEEEEEEERERKQSSLCVLLFVCVLNQGTVIDGKHQVEWSKYEHHRKNSEKICRI